MYAWSGTFLGCVRLTGDLVINSFFSDEGLTNGDEDFASCLSGAAIAEGCDLKLSGTSNKLNEILATGSQGGAHISLKNS